ncbi:MAG: hypothetical protein KAJ48_10335, partial [Elusimicrobiales bacterium]|nr:hypothetical protein [Elusimicrobiales bacterium]
MIIDETELGQGVIYNPSIASDSNGILNVVYRRRDDLKYAKWNGVSWILSLIEGNKNIYNPSIAIDAQGNSHIAYYDNSWDVTKYAKWNGTSWSTSTITGDTEVGHYLSIAVDGADNPHIAYGEGPLKYAKYNGISWSTYTITGAPFLTQIALSSKGEPYVAYWDYFTSEVKLATWNGSGFDSIVVVPTTGAYFKFVLDGYDHPHIVYEENSSNPRNLKYTQWNGVSWTSPETIVSDGYIKSFQLDGNGVPHVYYYTGASGGLYHAFKNGASWVSEIVDIANSAGSDASNTFDSFGKQQIVYKSGVNGLQLLFSQWTGTGYPLALGGNNRGKLQMPSSFQGIRTGKNINWTWMDNSSNEIGFKIYGSTISSGPFGLIDDSISAGVTSNDETSL